MNEYYREPDTLISLLHLNFNINNQDVLDFKNETEQRAFFNSHVDFRLEDATFQRANMSIRYNGKYDDIINMNYGFFKNFIKTDTDKIYYFFIENVIYLNENTCDIQIKIDVWQTYLFDYTFGQSFVERQHVSNDTIGANTINEGLETGEYVGNPLVAAEVFCNLNDWLDSYVCIGVSKVLDLMLYDPSHKYNGVYSGVTYFIFPTFNDATAYLINGNKKFGGEEVVSMFMLPQALSGYDGTPPFRDYLDPISKETLFKYVDVKPSDYLREMGEIKVYQPTNIDGYTPRNNKLLTYPYMYFNLSNNVGTSQIYKYELFTKPDGYCKFNIKGAIGVGCSIYAEPYKYAIGSANYDTTGLPADTFMYSVSAGKTPQCAWTNSNYANYVAKNGANLAVEGASGILQAFIGLLGAQNLATANNVVSPNSALGFTGEGIGGGLLKTAGVLATLYGESKVPDTAYNGANQGDYLYADRRGFTINKRSIKREFAIIIDDFFTMYGYKINRTIIPNFKTRKYFNFLKTIECKIKSNKIPQMYLDELMSIFNNGVTVWHDYNKMYDYSVNNVIL